MDTRCTEVRPDPFRPGYASPATPSAAPARDAPGIASLVLGVLIPVAVIVIECMTRMCASTFFDPLPTPWHVAVALTVPLANAAVWAALRGSHSSVRPPRPFPLALGIANGFAIAASLYYTFLFLPLLPFALVAVILYGMGLLPMAPLLAFITAVRLRLYMPEPISPRDNSPQSPGLWRGIAVGAVAVGAIVAPSVLTSHGLDLALSDDARTRESGVRFLRRFGSESQLLRACYARPTEFGLWDGFDRPRRADADNARKVFYRVTGRPSESMPSPFAARNGWLDRSSDWRDRDESLRGGESVGTLLNGLSVESSDLHGWLNADAATAYFEWTLVFRNQLSFAQEARTRIALPRGGCASRLTLWINGEEREAAWGARGKVRAAYEEVVKVQRRDPVLVTGAGPDRVMMQCFPVPPGGTMKVRVGMTAPLELAAGRGEVDLPRLLNRNFNVGEVPHAVRIESRAALSSFDTHLAPLTDRPGGLWGEVPDRGLCSRVKVAVARADNTPAEVWFDDTFDRRGGTIVQRIEPFREPPPTRIVLAIDGSAPMQHALSAVADALAGLPPQVAVTALVGSDAGAREFSANAGASADVAAALRDVRCVGGQDSVPLLARALGAAGQQPGAVIFWVYGPQPVVLEPTERLEKALGAATHKPRLVELQVSHGRNVVTDALSELARIESLAAGSDPGAALRRLFANWTAPQEKLRAVRTRQPTGAPEGAARRGDLQIVRLWAQDEVTRLLASTAPDARDAATTLAVSHQLVTPVSGAVVLETQAQYTAAGLTPVAAVPLPAGVWMALVTLPVLWYVWRRARAARLT